jgi:hypothetical protein
VSAHTCARSCAHHTPAHSAHTFTTNMLLVCAAALRRCCRHVWLIKPEEGLSTPLVFKHLNYDELAKEDPLELLRSFNKEVGPCTCSHTTENEENAHSTVVYTEVICIHTYISRCHARMRCRCSGASAERLVIAPVCTSCIPHIHA